MKRLILLATIIFSAHGMGSCSMALASTPSELHQEAQLTYQHSEGFSLAQAEITPEETPVETGAEYKAPETVEEAMGLLPALLKAIAEGKWYIVGSLVVLFLTAAARQYLIPTLNVSTKVLPWIALIIAFLNGWAAHMIGGIDIKEAAVMILVSGGLAAQMFSLGGKQVIELILAAVGKEVAK